MVFILCSSLISCNKTNKNNTANNISKNNSTETNVDKDDDGKIISVYLPLWKEIDYTLLENKNIDYIYLSFAEVSSNNELFFEDVNIDFVKSTIATLKSNKNINSKLILSIGGYGSEGFSDMALTMINRLKFIESTLRFLEENNLDGVDLDWEFPVQGGWGSIKSRQEDKENFTFLVKEFRNSLDNLEKKLGKKQYLSYAATTQSFGVKIIDLPQVEPYLDYINLMSYDYAGNWNKTPTLNSPLYNSDIFNIQESVDTGVQRYLTAGVPSQKLILGIPAYGVGWHLTKNNEKPESSLVSSIINHNEENLSYSSIKKNYIDNGASIFWDSNAKASYIIDNNKFITYESVESIKEKNNYIKKHNLGGIMLWEITQDNGDIITAMDK